MSYVIHINKSKPKLRKLPTKDSYVCYGGGVLVTGDSALDAYQKWKCCVDSLKRGYVLPIYIPSPEEPLSPGTVIVRGGEYCRFCDGVVEPGAVHKHWEPSPFYASSRYTNDMPHRRRNIS